MVFHIRQEAGGSGCGVYLGSANHRELNRLFGPNPMVTMRSVTRTPTRHAMTTTVSGSSLVLVGRNIPNLHVTTVVHPQAI